MNLSALISRFRILSGDHGVPAFWSDAEVTAYLNEAEREAAERARLLYDKTTAEVVQIALLPTVREYRLHPSIFDVDAAGILRPGGTRNCAVLRATEEDMRWSLQHRPNLSGWAGYYTIYGGASGDGTLGKYLTLDRQPQEAGGILYLEAYRYPLVEMEDGEDEPEIAPRYHEALVHWALYQAYSTRDAEGNSDARASKHEAEFERRFGLRDDANVARKKVRHRAPVVKAQRF